MSIEFDKRGVKISKNGIIEAESTGMLNNIPMIKLYAYTAYIKNKNGFKWHGRCGNVSSGKLLVIKRKNIFCDNLLNSVEPSDKICEPCLNGKQSNHSSSS